MVSLKNRVVVAIVFGVLGFCGLVISIVTLVLFLDHGHAAPTTSLSSTTSLSPTTNVSGGYNRSLHLARKAATVLPDSDFNYTVTEDLLRAGTGDCIRIEYVLELFDPGETFQMEISHEQPGGGSDSIGLGITQLPLSSFDGMRILFYLLRSDVDTLQIWYERVFFDLDGTNPVYYHSWGTPQASFDFTKPWSIVVTASGGTISMRHAHYEYLPET